MGDLLILMTRRDNMNYVIIGGVAAGMSAAMEIYRTDENAQITVLEQGEDYSYGQCGLPYVISGVVPSLDNLVARDVETFREKYNIDARTWTTVETVDFDNQVVSGVDTKTNKEFNISYDRLLIASGASPIFPDWKGSELAGIHTLGTIVDAENILKDLNEAIQNITIIGGGYIGLEAAESFVELGKEVTLIQDGPQVANIFDQDMAELIHKEAKEKGINLLLNEKVKGFEGEKRVEVVQTDKQTYKTDFVLLGIGVKPNTEFLKNTEINFSKQEALIVNPYQETNIKNVYAAGDCATNYHRVKQINDYIPLGTTANKQGRIAGANMAGKSMTFKGMVGTSILKFFDLDLGRTGITETEAQSLNIPYDLQDTEGWTHAGYYPGSKRMRMKVLYHKQTKEILGGQIIGSDGVDKRIDVLATALFNKMTISELADLDLAYSPPYNNVWDPLQQIARKS